MQNDLIIISDYCETCNIEPSFIELLREDGLIDIQEREGADCFPASELAALERYAHLYYDLSINIEGIDAIRHLLDRVEGLQREVRRLQAEVSFYRR